MKLSKDHWKLWIGILAIALILVLGAILLSHQVTTAMDQQGVSSPLELLDLPIPAAKSAD